MARPQSGDEPINVSFNCKMTETESDWLSSVSYTTGLSKSEVVRQAIRFAYAMVSDFAYKAIKEKEHSGSRYTINQIKDRVIEMAEERYRSFSTPESLIDEDDFLFSSTGDVPVKMSRTCLDEKGRALAKKLNQECKEQNKNAKKKDSKE